MHLNSHWLKPLWIMNLKLNRQPSLFIDRIEITQWPVFIIRPTKDNQMISGKGHSVRIAGSWPVCFFLSRNVFEAATFCVEDIKVVELLVLFRILTTEYGYFFIT